MEIFNPDSFVEEEDDIETLAYEPIYSPCVLQGCVVFSSNFTSLSLAEIY
jgi:hypothetical protein